MEREYGTNLAGIFNGQFSMIPAHPQNPPFHVPIKYFGG